MRNLLLALAAGAVLPIQAGVNAALRSSLGHPLAAALVSFSVGAFTLAALCLFGRVPLFPTAMPPLWQFVGGALGVIYVSLSIVLAPRLGATALVAAIITGQLVASLFLDHFGWLFPQHPATPTRLLGVVLLTVGVMLVLKRP